MDEPYNSSLTSMDWLANMSFEAGSSEEAKQMAAMTVGARKPTGNARLKSMPNSRCY